VSATVLAAVGNRLIEKETDEHRTSNVQHRTSNEYILTALKRLSEAIPSFDIGYSIFCGSPVRFLTASSYRFQRMKPEH
jgi:hypothetical protein